MNLSKKFDIYIIGITAVFVLLFAVFYSRLTHFAGETSELIDISRELDYLTGLKHTLTDMEHSIEHYLHIRQDSGYSNAVRTALNDYEYILKSANTLKLDPEEKQIIKFGLEHFEEFSAMVHGLLREGSGANEAKNDLYLQWKNNYTGRVLSEIDKHWKEDLEKVNRLSKHSLQDKKRALQMLLFASVVMTLILVFSRLVVSRFLVRPIKVIEDVSNAIAAGDTGKRIDIVSEDELGSLSTSINRMARAIEDRLSELNGSIEKEQAVVREQTILNELMGFIASGIGMEQVLRNFLGRTRDLLKAGDGCMFILEYYGGRREPDLKIFIDTSSENTSMDCAQAMLKGVFRNALRTLEPMRINSAMGEVPSTHVVIRNMLALPLLSIDKKLLGLIVLVNKEGGFTEEDEESLFNFSFQSFHAITMQQEIMRQATTDGLTGLYNHRIFMEKITEEFERARRYSRDLSLLMLDIDHFKSFNDRFGHQAGDDVLQGVADVILENIRNTDFGARYGGEEFAVILPETTAAQSAVVADRLRESISRHDFVLKGGERAHVTVSLGSATYPDDADSAEGLIKKADQGLYSAKEGGRNRACRYTESTKKETAGLAAETDEILFDVSLSSIKELAKAVDAKSNFTKGHSFEVAALSVMVGRQLGLSDQDIEGLRIASLLHDVGNLSVPDDILNKTGPLTLEEKKIIQGHPGLSEMLLKHYAKSSAILPAILYHHERFDGNGYPLGLAKDDIPFQAKILGTVEAYQAMISDRPYRGKKTRAEALKELEGESGKQFDPLVARTLLNILKKTEDPAEKRREKD